MPRSASSFYDSPEANFIDTQNTDRNKRIFDHLFAQKERIEGTFGGPLEWERRDERQSYGIVRRLNCGGLRDQEQ